MEGRRDIDSLLEAAVSCMRKRNIAAAVLFGSFAKRNIAAAVLFGSFAKGAAHSTSDIDIAVWPGRGWTVRDWDALQDDLEALPTLKKWDIVRMNGLVSPMLKEAIDRDGIVLYGSSGQS